jgi:hypothetical protein
MDPNAKSAMIELKRAFSARFCDDLTPPGVVPQGCDEIAAFGAEQLRS